MDSNQPKSRKIAPPTDEELKVACPTCAFSTQLSFNLPGVRGFMPVWGCFNEDSSNCGQWLNFKGGCALHEYDSEKVLKFQKKPSKLVSAPAGVASKLLRNRC